jgi:hypothetical protein
MALSNSEKQARWRERHIVKRRKAQRIFNLLVRNDLTQDHIDEIARLLRMMLNTRGIADLRRALKPITIG